MVYAIQQTIMQNCTTFKNQLMQFTYQYNNRRKFYIEANVPRFNNSNNNKPGVGDYDINDAELKLKKKSQGSKTTKYGKIILTQSWRLTFCLSPVGKGWKKAIGQFVKSN